MNNIKKKTRAICILGMHRSGTSTVARAINMMGVYLGEADDIMSPAPDNPEGFWERDDIVNVHDRLLQHYRKKWDTVSPLQEKWHKSEEIKIFREELIDIIRKHFVCHTLWAWKDPRTSLLLPIWKDILNELNVDLVCVFVVRNPLDVAKSLNKRNGFPYDKSYGIWFNYNVTALKAVSEISTYFISYDRLVSNWETELRLFSEAFDIPWPEDSRILVNEMNSFIKPTLRHSISDTDDMIKNGIPRSVLELHELLVSLTGHVETIGSNVAFKKLADEFYMYSRFFQDDMNMLWEKTRQLVAMDQQLAEMHRQLVAMDQQLAEMHRQLTEKSMQITEKDKQIDEKEVIIQRIFNSLSWRITAPLRYLYDNIYPGHLSTRRKRTQK